MSHLFLTAWNNPGYGCRHVEGQHTQSIRDYVITKTLKALGMSNVSFPLTLEVEGKKYSIGKPQSGAYFMQGGFLKHHQVLCVTDILVSNGLGEYVNQYI